MLKERLAVQNPLLQYAQDIGWEYAKPEEALRLRDGFSGMYFAPVLEAQLLRLNPNVVDSNRAADIVRRLNLLNPSIEGNREALAWMKGERSVFVPEENRERIVKLIDFEHPNRNLFHVTEEWRHKNAAFVNRADAVFLINGLPVAVCETKASHKPNAISEGVDQIRRYHRETPEMLIAPQVFEVTQLLDFYYGVTWNANRKNLFNWRDEAPENFERRVKTFFERPRFLRMLHDYVIFVSKDDQLSKVILRQHQTRAVEKALDRVLDPSKRRGLIWHTQGSGKTLTMITIAAKLLREAPTLEKPTVLMLVDRNELEAQLFKNIAGYGLSAKVADSKAELRAILRSDYRGLIVSMIHKFDEIDKDINKRESIIVLVDEAHRTTSGDLGNYLMGALPNATYIGFTGTPIDTIFKGKGTFKVFGVDDERGYLDKYSIAESIEDGATVQLNYALAPSDLRVDRETLEKEFLSLKEAEGVSDPEELSAILDRAVELKEIMKADDRVEKIAAFVARHFRENVEPMGFKAFLVAVDREACAFYKKALDKYLPPEYSRVVYSPAHNDKELLKTYYLDEETEKGVRKEFIKKGKLPKILIVTEKLLTGFDAPILYCMYLDKPMRDHVLLQAIARVNRPYEDDEGQVKPYGFVLDFVGIFEKLERALAFDSDVVGAVIQNVDVLKALFAKFMKETAPAYLPLTKGWDDKAKERAIQYFAEQNKRETFYKFFKQLQSVYDILSPDVFLREFLEDYLALAELYGQIRNAYSAHAYVDRELTAKTRELLRRQSSSTRLEPPGAIHELGVKELAALRDSSVDDHVKILNLSRILAQTAATESGAQPFLISIGERAEALRQRYEDRQLETQQALAQFVLLGQECVDAEAERKKLGVDDNTFAIISVLRPLASGLSTEQAKELNEVFERFPDYQWNEQQQGRLRTESYKKLRTLVSSDKLVDAANAMLNLKRI